MSSNCAVECWRCPILNLSANARPHETGLPFVDRTFQSASADVNGVHRVGRIWKAKHSETQYGVRSSYEQSIRAAVHLVGRLMPRKWLSILVVHI